MPKYIAMGLSLPPDLRAKLEAEPDKTAVAKPATPQRIALGIPKIPIELAFSSPHSAMDNNPLGLGNEDSTRQDATRTRRIRLKKPTIRNFLINPSDVYNPTSPLPPEMLADTSLIWRHLKKKDTSDGQ